eukprot:5657463-Prymnesium_polylepis.1
MAASSVHAPPLLHAVPRPFTKPAPVPPGSGPLNFTERGNPAATSAQDAHAPHRVGCSLAKIPNR